MTTLNTVLMNACLAAAAIAIGSQPAFAYKLYTSGGCTNGKKWNTSTPVQVKLLYDSFIAYEDGKGINDFFTRTSDLLNLLNDVNEVVDEYNSAYGIDIRLEVGTAITGVTTGRQRRLRRSHRIISFRRNEQWPGRRPPTTAVAYPQTHLFMNKNTLDLRVPTDLIDGNLRQRLFLPARSSAKWARVSLKATP
jgi:hypothetical protein